MVEPQLYPMKHHHPIYALVQPVIEFIPCHDAIAARARELWIAFGCPANGDEAIWLEAQGQLVTGTFCFCFTGRWV